MKCTICNINTINTVSGVPVCVKCEFDGKFKGAANKAISEAIEVVRKYCNVTLTPTQMKKLLQANADLFADIFVSGANDTVTREWLIDTLAESLEVGHWPMNCEGRLSSFYPKFLLAAQKAGYVVFKEKS